MSIKISLTDCTEILDYSKSCAANATKNKLGADTSKDFLLRAKKLDDDNSSASIDEITEKLRQTAIYRANNASAQNNQVKENDKNRMKKLFFKRKIYVATKEVTENNKKVAIRAKKLGDDNSLARFDDVPKKLKQRVIYLRTKALAQVESKVKGIDKPRSEQGSEQQTAKQKNKSCCCGNEIKEKSAEFKPTLIPLECSKFTKNTSFADNVPVKYQQSIDRTAQTFTLMPFNKQTDPCKFAFLKQYLQNAHCEEPESFVNLKHAKIYKINGDGFDSDEINFGKCLMLHGTSFECSRKILNEGYKSSAYGYFGKGVYMTESLDIAVQYSARKTLNDWNEEFCEDNIPTTYVFVNQVFKPKSLKIKKYASYHIMKNNCQPLKHPFCKHMHQDSTNRKMKMDTEGRYHIKVPGLSLLDEYVADDSLVIPRFLIEIEPSGFDFNKFTTMNDFWFNKIK